MMSAPVTVGEIEVNGAEIHYELRGSGPRLLFIPGAEGDAEEYLRVVVALEDRFSILSYDRRAFSRSARPADYVGTTVEQQADDAAALVRALNFAPASVWGNSSGAIIGLSLVLRHSDVVETAMLHEPPLFAGMNDWQSQLAFLQKATAEGKVPFLRMLTGDEVYNSLSEAYRARLETDRTWIDHEFDVFEYYRPSDDELANITRPVKVLYGADSPPFFGEAAHWLAGRLGSEPETIRGGHGVHYEFPDEVAAVITRSLER